MPIDPRRMALTPEGRTAERLADLERRQSRTDATNLNYALTATLSAPWVAPTLINSYSNFGAGYAPVAYYKDAFERVYLRGAVAVPASPITTVFVLATGYRPVFLHDFFVAGEYAGGIAQALISINTSGNVSVSYTNVGLAGKIAFDSISFRAA